MLRDEDSAFARVALQMELLVLEDLLAAVAAHVRRDTGSTLRETLVRDGYLSEDEAVAAARAVLDRPLGQGLRGPRYQVGELLGKGANGAVHLAGDQRLGRYVALKMHGKGAALSDIELGRFSHEAQVTGQLAHPSIVPVHDLGVLPDGRPFYTMKRIEGDTLKDVFDGVNRDTGDYFDVWTVPHFAGVLLRVAQAAAFAHDRGVIHRDIKPANIMVGDYGEVLLLDWGVARVLGQAEPGFAPVATWRSEGDDDMTVVGTVAGTPAYMAPEQARGDIDAIGPASDVYSIGIVLYEYLTGSRPFRASNVRELLDKVIVDPIKRPSETRTRRDVPPELEALCMKCVHKDPKKRYPHGRALAEALQGFLEGSRKREEAAALTRRAMGKSTAYTRAAEAAGKMEETLQRYQATLAPWSPEAENRPVQDTQRQWLELRSLRDDTYDEAVALYQAALEAEPRNRDARGGLAALYLRRMDEAEARGDSSAARFFRSQVLRYDLGVLRSILEGPSTLELTLDPPDARAVLCTLLDGLKGLVETQREELTAPLSGHRLEPGTYALQLSAEGCDPIVVALHADRPSRITHTVRLPRSGELEAGMIPIPAGPYPAGGDPLAVDGEALREIRLATYAIGRYPVTVSEFQRFLEETGSAAGFECWIGPEDVPASEKPHLPALGVSLDGALAYAAWLSTRSRTRFRLPTHAEWEKAARGVDKRIFPWGSRWDPTACNNPDAVGGPARPRAVGSFPRDVSVYGVMDLAGGVSEWVSGPVPHRPARAWLRGGSWNSRPQQARICSRQSAEANSRGGTIGFRLVQELF
ncbi:MAG: SUMF1/EgtB/PvdO family nonheme iron enzyme [Proteobacteria bacterium]|nr:SUMF1/EgtB/PvdO family nonheme iron enzyme [Pseudomonadota bacterium]